MFDKFRKKEGKLYTIYSNIDELFERTDDNHVFMLASGIAFNISLYIIPTFLVAIYIVNVFIDTAYIVQILEKVMTDFMPPTESSTDIIHAVIEEVQKISLHSSLAGWIGIFSLLWISSILISSLRSALNAIFHIPAKKIFIIYRLTDILVTLVLTVLILVYSYVVPMVNFIISFLDEILPELVQGFLSSAILMGVSLSTSFILFFFIFYFIPTKRLPLFVSFYSTVLCVIMIEISRHIFGWYISGFSSYGKFYGTYAVLISMVIWIYYSSFILLMSAEIVNFIYEKREKRRVNEYQKEFDIAEQKKSKPHTDTEIDESLA